MRTISYNVSAVQFHLLSEYLITYMYCSKFEFDFIRDHNKFTTGQQICICYGPCKYGNSMHGDTDKCCSLFEVRLPAKCPTSAESEYRQTELHVSTAAIPHPNSPRLYGQFAVYPFSTLTTDTGLPETLLFTFRAGFLECLPKTDWRTQFASHSVSYIPGCAYQPQHHPQMPTFSTKKNVLAQDVRIIYQPKLKYTILPNC